MKSIESVQFWGVEFKFFVLLMGQGPFLRYGGEFPAKWREMCKSEEMYRVCMAKDIALRRHSSTINASLMGCVSGYINATKPLHLDNIHKSFIVQMQSLLWLYTVWVCFRFKSFKFALFKPICNILSEASCKHTVLYANWNKLHTNLLTPKEKAYHVIC